MNKVKCPKCGLDSNRVLAFYNRNKSDFVNIRYRGCDFCGFHFKTFERVVYEEGMKCLDEENRLLEGFTKPRLIDADKLLRAFKQNRVFNTSGIKRIIKKKMREAGY